MVLMGCDNHAQSQESGTTDLQKQIIGKWWSDDKWLNAPFSLVTLYEDGRFTRFNTNIPHLALGEGYWRVTNNWVTLTPDRNGMPVDSLEEFKVDHISDRDMVFTNSNEDLRINLKKYGA